MRRSAGFTLLEVLLATALLAMALTLAFATQRAAGATAQRGEALAERNERSRAVSDFLRRRIGGAQGIVLAGGQKVCSAGLDVPYLLSLGEDHAALTDAWTRFFRAAQV